MNLPELMRQYSHLLENQTFPNGVYMSSEPNQDTKDAIASFCAIHDVPNPVKKPDMHCTVIYSTKSNPDFECQSEYKELILGEFDGYEMFGDNKDILVMKIKSSGLVKRHKELMKEYDLTYSYDKYIPHITLSYDASDFDVESLPRYNGPIMFSGESANDLDD